MIFDAEADFQRVADAYSRLPRVEATISVSSRTERSAPFYNSIDIWFRYERPGKVDVLIADTWGNPTRLAADGKTVLMDSFAVTLTKASGDPLDNGVLTDGSGASPFYSLLKKGGVKERFQITGPITSDRGTYSFFSRKYGKTTVYVAESNGFPTVTRFEYSSQMQQLASWLMFPMFGEKPRESLTREDISVILDPQWPKTMFSTRPMKGTQLIDSRGGEALVGPVGIEPTAKRL